MSIYSADDADNSNRTRDNMMDGHLHRKKQFVWPYFVEATRADENDRKMEKPE